MHSGSMAFNADLMRRYDREGPRYTSYPSARQFRAGLLPGDYERAARSSEGALRGDPLSVYVHLPFCYSPCFYCGCNRVITHDLSTVDVYVRHLLQEIELRSAYFGRERTVEQLHFGGGTPTFLPKKLLMEVIDCLGRELQFSDHPGRDYSIEIDPRGVDHGILQLLAALGFNRISLGVQDFDENVQRAVNRVQTAALVERTYESARALGFGSINFDLIYGLPLQTLSTFGATLDRVVKMRPDRLAVYGYAHMPTLFKAQRQIRREELPDAPARLALLQLTVERLCAAGYVYIGMDHFALPTDSLAKALDNGTLHRSFQGYTTHANRDLVSFGASAIGQVGNVYIQNYKSVADYQQAVAAGLLPQQLGMRMSEDDAIRRDAINQIMCQGVLDMRSIESRYGMRFDEYFGAELIGLEELERDGLVQLSGQAITLTPAGRLLMRNVAMTFDAYATAAANLPMSRAI